MRITNTSNSPEFKGAFSFAVNANKANHPEVICNAMKQIRRGCFMRSVPSHICVGHIADNVAITPVVTGKVDYAKFCDAGHSRDKFFAGKEVIDVEVLTSAMQEGRFDYETGAILDKPARAGLYSRFRGAVYDSCQRIFRQT